MAGATGFEPATSGVTSQCSTGLSYTPTINNIYNIYDEASILSCNIFEMGLNLYMMQKRTYQLLNIVRPNLSTDKVQQVIDTSCAFQHEDEKSEQSIKMMDLSYKMDHSSQGYLVVTKINTTPDRIRQMRTRLELKDDIVRTMFIVKTEDEFAVDDATLEQMKSYTTKRGKIMFPKYSTRSFKAKNSRNIKRLRFLGLLPYCNYYA